MKICEVASAIFVRWTTEHGDIMRDPQRHAREAYRLAEAFMAERDDYLASRGLDDDGRPV